MALFTRGVSLLEFSVTLSIVAVLLVAAVPSYNNYVANATVTGAANNFASSLATARAEAIRYGTRAVVSPLDGANWLSGWIVFIDKNGSGRYEAGSDEMLASIASTAVEGLSLNNARTSGLSSVAYIGFDSAGITQGPIGSNIIPRATLTFRHPANRREQTIIVERSGKIWVCNPLDSNATRASGCQ